MTVRTSATQDVFARDGRWQTPGAATIGVKSKLAIDCAKGAHVWDSAGRKYLDLFMGVGSSMIGHADGHFTDALGRQLARGIVGTFASDARADFLNRLAVHFPPPLRHFQLYSTGSEAVEAAIKLSRAASAKASVIAFSGGFHGKTMGSLSLHGGSRRHGFGPLIPGVLHARYGSVKAVEQAANELGHDLAAIIVEPVQGTAGNIVPDDGFLKNLSDLAHRSGAILIVDEVITGFGRTGVMFRSIADALEPDIVVMGKAMGSGVPLSGLAVHERLLTAHAATEPSAASSTFGGNPLAAAAGLATLEVIERKGLVARAQQLGALCAPRLGTWVEEVPLVDEVHCKGLMIGIGLRNPESGDTLAPNYTDEIFHRLLDAGVLAMAYADRIRLYPPAIIDEDDLMHGLDILQQVLVTVGKTID